MLLFVTVIHFFVALLLIVFVLLQDSKGGGVFGMNSGGGGSQVFSATGAANFLVKTTRVLAVMFAITCITLTYLTTKKQDSVVDGFIPATTPVEAPATPPVEAPPATTDNPPTQNQ